MAIVIKGTTPTITYAFRTVSIGEIAEAILTVKAEGRIIIERGLDTAVTGEDTLSWKLTQEETLQEDQKATIMLNWVLADGTRGASAEMPVTFSPNHIEEVI